MGIGILDPVGGVWLGCGNGVVSCNRYRRIGDDLYRFWGSPFGGCYGCIAIWHHDARWFDGLALVVE